jgi:hypothetical protein
MMMILEASATARETETEQALQLPHQSLPCVNLIETAKEIETGNVAATETNSTH